MLKVSESSSGIPVLEPGTYPAVCYGLVDLGDQYSKVYQSWSRRILILWELPGETVELEDGPSSRVISAFYRLSLSERANLRRDLASWRGRDFTAEELKGFDLRCIVGAPCLLSVVHKDRAGVPHAEVGAVLRLGKGMQVDRPRLDPIVFDVDEDDMEKVDELPEWIAKLVRESPQYKRRAEGEPVPVPAEDPLYDEGDDADTEDVPF